MSLIGTQRPDSSPAAFFYAKILSPKAWRAAPFPAPRHKPRRSFGSKLPPQPHRRAGFSPPPRPAPQSGTQRKDQSNARNAPNTQPTPKPSPGRQPPSRPAAALSPHRGERWRGSPRETPRATPPATSPPHGQSTAANTPPSHPRHPPEKISMQLHAETKCHTAPPPRNSPKARQIPTPGAGRPHRLDSQSLAIAENFTRPANQLYRFFPHPRKRFTSKSFLFGKLFPYFHAPILYAAEW